MMYKRFFHSFQRIVSRAYSTSLRDRGCSLWIVATFIIASHSLLWSMHGSFDADSSTADSLNATAGPEILMMVDDSTAAMQADSVPSLQRMPEFKTFIEPEYPLACARQGIEGTVLLDLVVNDSGRVDSVAVVKSAHPLLDSSVTRAARNFLFTPALADNKPIAVLIQYEKKFALEEASKRIQQYANFNGLLLELGTKQPITNALIVLSYLSTVPDSTLLVPFSEHIKQIGSFDGQYLEEDNLVTTTDSLGRFTYYSLPAGVVEITAVLPGYEEFRQREMLQPKESISAKYYASRVTYSDYEIVAYGRAVEHKEISRRKLNLAEVKKIAGFGGDAIKVVQALPGVARPTFGSSEIAVRGSRTSDSRFFIDGIYIPVLFHFGAKSTYNSEALQSVDFYPGGFGSRYGNAIAGVIEITTRKARTKNWKTNIDGNFFDGSFIAEGPVSDKVSILASGRRSFIGDLIKAVSGQISDVQIMTTAPYYWDYICRGDVDINARQKAYGMLFGVQDGAKLIVSDNSNNGSQDIETLKNQLNYVTRFHMALTGWDWDITGQLKNTMRFSEVLAHEKLSAFGFYSTTMDYVMSYLRDQLAWSPTQSLKLSLGADISLINVDHVVATMTGTKTVQKDTTKNWLFGDVAAYANSEWKVLPKLLFVAGLRYDYYPELNYNGAWLPSFWEYKDVKNSVNISGEPSVRLFSKYELTKKQAVKASIGTYNETPQPFGETIHKTWGNPRMSASRASQYIVGYEWQASDVISLDIQAYYNRQWRLPRGPTQQELIAGSPLYLDDGKKKVKGLELMLRHDQDSRFFGWVAYSLSQSKRYSFDLRKYILFSKDQTHNLMMVGTWFLPMQWDVGCKIQFTSGDPETPPIGYRYNGTTHSNDIIWGEYNSGRLPSTFQIDLRVDKKMVYKNWIYSAYIEFFNIGYFLYKSPQMSTLDPVKPFDLTTNRPNRRYIYQYSIPSIGVSGQF
ncbi:MAG: TonB family protein [Chitinivibrionales bacterium]|nr:TonB family protein [Chitinivibrionales bacterium]